MSKVNFSQNVAKLATGNFIAQIISVAAVPVITRLYDPAQFGIYSIFLGVIGLISPISTLQFQAAIMLQAQDHLAWLLRRVAIYSVFSISALSCIVTVIMVIGARYDIFFLSLAMDNTIVWLIAPAVLFQGMLQVNSTWIMRRNAFGSAAIARVFESVVDRMFGVVCGLFHPMAVFLASGKLISGMAAWWYSRAIVHKEPVLKGAGINNEAETVGHLARKYFSFAFFSTIAYWLFVAARELPLILLGAMFGPAFAAYYALGLRVVNMPMMSVGDAISHAFFQRTAVLSMNFENITKPALHLVRMGLLLATPPMLLVGVHGQVLFSMLFGEQWSEAGMYATVLAPIYLVQFVCRPIETLFDVLEQQKKKVVWATINLVGRVVGIMSVVACGGSVIIAVLSITIVSVVTQTSGMLYLLRQTGATGRQIGAVVARAVFLLAPILIGLPLTAIILKARIALIIGIVIVTIQLFLLFYLDPDMRQLFQFVIKKGKPK